MMRRLLLLAPILLPSGGAAQSQQDGQSAESHLVEETDRFTSKALGRRLPFTVLLPKSHDKDRKRRYPWILYLHGMWENHRRFVHQGAASLLSQQIAAKKLPEVVFVCAEGGSDSFYINGKHSGRWEDMIIHDLLPHIEAKYPVRKGRAHRGLLGISMGGFGAMKIALKHPKIFAAVATHSAALLPRCPHDLAEAFPWLGRRGDRLIKSIFGRPTDQKMWQRESALCLADKIGKDQLAGLRIYFDCGTADRFGFHDPNTELHKVLRQRKITHKFASVPKGGHGWTSGYNRQQLPKSLAFLGRVFREHAKKPAGRALHGEQSSKPQTTSRPTPNKK